MKGKRTNEMFAVGVVVVSLLVQHEPWVQRPSTLLA